MKSLKEHILEGILDIEDNINYDISKDVIEEFLKENYDIKRSYTIKGTKDGFIVDVKGDVKVKNKNIISLTNGFFEFGLVRGHFDCEDCDLLKSLKGAPKEVGKYFDCSNCNSLTSLEGSPKEVGWSFYCSNCKLLKSLEGAPEEVEGFFKCSVCESLRSLKGAPQKVGGDFYCQYCDNLKSLEGAPKEVFGDFHCYDCGVKFTEEDIRKYTKVTKKIYV